MAQDRDGGGPPPPWTLEGEAVVAMALGGAGTLGPVAEGIDRLPGPVLVLAATWQSPVGPYRELAVAVPARLGVRVGWSVTTMVVDSEASLAAGRDHWGMPKELGRLGWQPSADHPELGWDERALTVRCGSAWRVGPPLPLLLPFAVFQQRGGELVSVPGRARGRARPALIEVAAPAGDPLSALGGRHPGLHLPEVRLWLGPAKPV